MPGPIPGAEDPTVNKTKTLSLVTLNHAHPHEHRHARTRTPFPLVQPGSKLSLVEAP